MRAMRSIAIVAVLGLALSSVCAQPTPTTLDIKTPLTIPYDRSLRPQTTYLVFDNTTNPTYGPVDIRVADNYTGNAPSQIHLSIAGPQAYIVMWATGKGKTGQAPLTPNNPNLVASIVQYGYSADNLQFQETGYAEASVYDQIYNNVDPNKAGVGSAPNATNYTSPVLHNVVIKNLIPSKMYYYRVGDGVTFSQIYNFTVVAAAGPTYPQRLLLVADWGLSLNSTTTLYHLQRSLQLSPSATAVMNIGDLSYADDTQTTGFYGQVNGVWQYGGNEGFTSRTYQPVWDAWLRFLQPLIANIPMLATPGNHEVEQQNVLSKYFESYKARFKNAHRASGSKSPEYYSVDIGPTHNIFLSSYSDYTQGSDQWNWLQNDLQSIDRTKTPWVTCSTHHPWYTTDTSYKEFDQMRQQMEPLLYKYGVDIFFNGHVHAYERIAPVNNFTIDTCGTVHITIGDGGNQEGLSGLNYLASSNGADPLAHLYQDTLNGCPTRSTNPAVNDATRINSTNPRAFRPTGMTPLDGNSNRALPLNSSFDPWYYYQLSPIYQGDGNTTGSNTFQQSQNPKGYCYKEQPPWSQYRESSFGHGTLDIINSTHALWHWLRNQDDQSGPLAVVTDPIFIVRDLANCANKKGVPQPPQPPITTPSPTPSPTTPPTVPTPPTPTPTKQVGPLEKIAGDLNTLHQDTFGFQQKKQGAGLQQQDVDTSLPDLQYNVAQLGFEPKTRN